MAVSYEFSVVLEPQEGGGYTVLVPALPEVVTESDTESEALANAKEAIRGILAWRRDHGIAIPDDALPEVRRCEEAAEEVREDWAVLAGGMVASIRLVCSLASAFKG
ncbi:MAG: type II toxin-antitoxin system HicB family antitoxin [Rhizomicrobium sp.]